MPDPFQKKQTKKQKVWKITKAIFLTKFPTCLLYTLLIIIISIVAFEFIKPDTETPTGQAVLEPECPECPECICENAECEPDCSTCPVKTKIEKEEIIYYSCPDGTLVEDMDDCEENFPDIEEEYSGTVEGITLAIDNIEIEEDEDDSGFVTRVDYTIINKGDLTIVPKIEVKVYEEWTLKVKKSVANKEIYPEVAVKPNEYVQRQDRVRIYFQGEQQTLRLLLVDRLTKIENEILAVTRDFSLD
jgi:hypothetical protein